MSISTCQEKSFFPLHISQSNYTNNFIHIANINSFSQQYSNSRGSTRNIIQRSILYLVCSLLFHKFSSRWVHEPWFRSNCDWNVSFIVFVWRARYLEKCFTQSITLNKMWYHWTSTNHFTSWNKKITNKNFTNTHTYAPWSYKILPSRYN